MRSVSKRLAPPAWWKNTYFWIAAILIVVSILGFARGDEFVRDPGQTDEPHLTWIYLAGAILMMANGVMSHRSYVKHYGEVMGEEVEETTKSAILEAAEREGKSE